MACSRPTLVCALLLACGAPLAAQQVASVQLSHRRAELKIDGRLQVYATAYDASGNILLDQQVTWTCADVAVARVEPDPDQSDLATVIAVGPGETRVTARVGGKSESMTVRVERPVVPVPPRPPAVPPTVLRIEPANIQLLPAESRQLQVVFLREDGSAASPVPVTWASLTPAIASVNDAGVIVGLSDGSGVIEARTDAGLTTRASVEVAATPFWFSVSVLSLSPDQEQPIVVVVPGQGNRALANTAFTWRSSDESVVRVTPLGVARGMAPGSAVITAEGLGRIGELQVAVHRPVVMLGVTPADSEVVLPINGSRRFTARGLAADTTPVPEAPLFWTVGDTTVARFDRVNGVLTGTAIGRTELVVASAAPGPEVRWRINVIAGGITVVPDRGGIGVGDTLPLAARFTDAAGRDLGPASGVSWTSLNPDVAQVTQSGTVSAVGIGRAGIVVAAPWGRSDTAVVFIQGRLLFSSTRAGSADLWTIDPEAPERLRQVTSGPRTETNGSFSPDGASIAYVADPDGRFDVYVASADGSDPRRLTNTPETELTPRFTRDGRAIVYSAPAPGGGRAQIWIANLDGTAPRQLTTGDATNVDPAPSPDGRSIAFTSTRDGEYQIYLMDLDGGNPRRAHVSRLKETHPAWFPNGDLAYIQERGDGGRITSIVVRQPAAGGEPTVLTPEALAVTDFAVSGAGNLLALEVSGFARDGGLVSRIVLLPLDGRPPRDLPRASEAEQQGRPAFLLPFPHQPGE
jgi:uncharacterized protein YjdB